MVAKITFPHSLSATLNYNEKKVQRGVAECLGGEGFLNQPAAMTFYQKLRFFEFRHSLNSRASTKVLHVSLNFHSSEILSSPRLQEIAQEYVKGIGFGDQPFLVYQHNDAGHPHLHIVTTTIRSDGSRINTHNIGRMLSEPTRKKIEERYGLMRASDQRKMPLPEKKSPDLIRKADYGKEETRRAIARILGAVIHSYNFTSLPALNAVLQRYGVRAERGSESSRMYRQGGLLYHLLDDKGAKIGVPVKASRLPGSPTLAYLEQKFSRNQVGRKIRLDCMRQQINIILSHSPDSWDDFTKSTYVNGLVTVLRKNEEGRVYGVTFIDERNKWVCNGSELGKQYSAAELEKNWRLTENDRKTDTVHFTPPRQVSKDIPPPSLLPERETKPAADFSVLNELLSPQQDMSATPFDLRKKKKRRNRKRSF